MKKFLSLFVILALVLSFSAVMASAAAETTNLIPEDGDWSFTVGEAVAPGTITQTFDGTTLKMTADKSWPSAIIMFDEPLLLDPETTVINLKFKIVSGGTSIRLFGEKPEDAPVGFSPEQIILHQFCDSVTEDVLDNAGDLLTAGTYELSAKLSDLKFYDNQKTPKYNQRKDLVLNDDGLCEFYGIEIYCLAGGSIEIEKLEVVVGADEPAESSDAPESSVESISSTPSANETTTSSTSSTAPGTGDIGIAAVAIIMIVMCAGVYMVKKAR